MQSYINGGASAFQVTKHPTGVLKVEATVDPGADANSYVSIYDSAVAPVAGTAAVKSWPADEAGYKEFKKGELRLTKGCYVALSADPLIYNDATGPFTVLQVELYEAESPTGTTVVGSDLSQVGSIVVWANNAGPKKLLEVVVDDSAASLTDPLVFMQVHADVNIANSIPALVVLPVKKGQRNVFSFGQDGLPVAQRFQGAEFLGCAVGLTTAASGYDEVADGCVIKAEYK